MDEEYDGILTPEELNRIFLENLIKEDGEEDATANQRRLQSIDGSI